MPEKNKKEVIRMIQANLLAAEAARTRINVASLDTPEDRARAEAAARGLAEEVAAIEALLAARPA